MASSIPETMTAIEIATLGGPPEVLRPVQRPVPDIAPHEVLIHVASAGVNRPDVSQRKGLYPPPPGVTDIPGLEVAGEIVRVGEGADFREGDRVCALVAGGGYAEYVAAPAVQCLPVPPGLSLEEGAVLPEAFLTVFFNVFERANLRERETLLVHGGASGIGTTAILLAKAYEANVIVTAGTEEKCRACRALGADYAINYKEQDFVEETLRFTRGRGVDVVLDMVGGDYVARDIACMAADGRIALIGIQGGQPQVHFDLKTVLARRLTLAGSTLRAQSVSAKGRLVSALRREVWPYFSRRRLRPVIHARFPLTEAAKAHALMESDTHIGKIVLNV